MPDRDTRGLSHRARVKASLGQPRRSVWVERSYEEQRQRDPQLSEAARLRRGWRWRQLAARWLRKHPTCAKCKANGFTTAATSVDHVVQLTEAPGRVYDKTNLESLCGRCHGRKSARERYRRRTRT